MIYDVQVGAWIYFEYPNSLKKEARNHYAQRRGYFPYNFNFVKGHRGDLAQCFICGVFIPMKQMTRDHVFPKSLGGEITTTACTTCNSLKGNTKPIEWAIKSLNYDFMYNLYWTKTGERDTIYLEE